MKRVGSGIGAPALTAAVLLLGAAACGGGQADPEPEGRRLTLYTHCGVLSARVDHQLWLADPQRPDGYDDPLIGWDENSTEGTWRELDGGRAEFRSDSGQVASFVLARPGQPDPAARCE